MSSSILLPCTLFSHCLSLQLYLPTPLDWLATGHQDSFFVCLPSTGIAHTCCGAQMLLPEGLDASSLARCGGERMKTPTQQWWDSVRVSAS